MDEATGQLGGNELISERRYAPETWNFSIQVAKDWEAAFFETPTPRTRKVAMRSAIIFSPMPGTAFAIFSNLVRLGLGGTPGQWPPIRLLDSRVRLCPRRRVPHRTRRSRRPRQHRLAQSAAQPRVHGRSARSLERAQRPSHACFAHRARRLLPPHRIRTGPQEPPRRPHAPARRRLRIRFPRSGPQPPKTSSSNGVTATTDAVFQFPIPCSLVSSV